MSTDTKQVADRGEQAGTARQEKVARWEDCVDIFLSPAALFRRRAQDRVGPPLAMLLVLAVAVHLALIPANAMVMRAAVATDPRAAEMLSSFGTLMQVLGAIFVPIQYLLAIVGAAILLWIGGRMAEVPVEFSRAVLIAVYAAFVQPLSEVVTALLVVLHGEAGLDIVRHGSLGVLRFLGSRDVDPLLLPLLDRLEIFAIWQACLWAVGLAVLYGTGRVRAAVVAAVAWALSSVPGIAGALIGMAAGR
ncbi:MAG TPA: YIP1 family protein [Longimicrobiales bacterium]